MIDLLGTGAGTFVYHLMILLALLAAAGISFIEYQRTSNPDQHRILRAFSFLFGIRILLLFADSIVLEPSASSPLTLLRTIIPLLVYALEVTSLTLIWWAFLSPLTGRRPSGFFLFGNLGAVVVVTVAFFPFWHQAVQTVPLSEYASFGQHTIWDLWAVALSLSGAVLLFVNQRRLGYVLPAVSFLFLSLGNAFILFEIVGLGRLTNLISYPIIVVAVYRSALQDLYAYREELETLSEGSLRQTRELLFLVEASRALGKSLDLDTMLSQVTESVCHVLDADRVAVLLTNEEADNVELAAQYIPLQRTLGSHPAIARSLDDQPILRHVVHRRKQVVLDSRGNKSRMRALHEMIGSSNEGPVILQPLAHHHRVLGVLVVGRDQSKRPFRSAEERLCDSVASQIAASIDNARLYQNLTEALRQQEEEAGRRKAILESINEGIIVNNSEGRAVLMNAAAEEIIGLRREQVLGRSTENLLEAAAADLQMDVGQLQELSAPLQTLFELRNQQVLVNAAPVRSADGEDLGVVAVLRDITKETQAEEAKREFITVISHELRTPLTAILGYAEAISSGMVGAVTESQSQFIRTIQGNARRMVAMTDNLIALSDTERGGLDLKYKETDLTLIAGEVIQAFSAQMQSKHIEWKVDVQGELPLVEADPARIRQVLANLVSNAVKFTLPGGHITVGGAAVKDPGEEEPSYCRLWVDDTGIGIPPEKQVTIWERFSQSEGRIQEEVDGLGLGLSIVKSLVEAHRGRVWVDSATGRGSTFTILLPIQQPTHSPFDVEAFPPSDTEEAAS
jgi:PAS domain S-box-containing protein